MTSNQQGEGKQPKIIKNPTDQCFRASLILRRTRKAAATASASGLAEAGVGVVGGGANALQD